MFFMVLVFLVFLFYLFIFCYRFFYFHFILCFFMVSDLAYIDVVQKPFKKSNNNQLFKKKTNKKTSHCFCESLAA